MNDRSPVYGQSPDTAAAASALGPALQSAGGIDGLMEKLRGGGLGGHVDSWVSPGPNEPVDPQMLGQALGPETTARMSSQTGLDVGQLLPLLAAVLPQLINMLTPDGNVPRGGLDQAAGGMPNLGGLLGGLLGGSTGSGGSGAGGLDDMLGGLGGMLGGAGSDRR
jgi:uncharacterized protein YidB (DUF937 family)